MKNKIEVFGMWFDIYNGDVYVFSYEQKAFIKLDDQTHKNLSQSLSI